MKRELLLEVAAIAATGLLLATASAAAQPESTASAPMAGDLASAASAPGAIRMTDRQLKRAIGTRLARTRGLDSTRILIRTSQGAVVLLGSVPEQAQIALAASAAQSVPGVASVKNGLRVERTPGAAPTDPPR